MSKRTVLVTGATGNQGGAVADALLSRGHAVKAFVRNPESAKAVALAERGAQLVKGDFDHGDTVAAAAAGVDAAFVVTSPFAPGVGLEGEVRQGRVVVDALVQAQVPHVVYSSVSDADRGTGIGHFESKMDAERRLAESGLAVTITAPVFFSDNLLMPWLLPGLKQGVMRHALPPERVLQVVSVAEIGRFNAAVIARGAELAGRRIDYASDELSSVAMAQAIAEASGRPLRFEPQPIEQLQSAMAEMADMYRWFDQVGYSADVAGLREEFPEVGWQTFAQWAHDRPWSTLMAGA
ncbi:MAG: NmrA family NAD(P)-binding protein [Myxococcales bacterium]|nr:NmrA family NAD(P)-binding protein [Myxococcales bacterium]